MSFPKSIKVRPKGKPLPQILKTGRYRESKLAGAQTHKQKPPLETIGFQPRVGKPEYN